MSTHADYVAGKIYLGRTKLKPLPKPCPFCGDDNEQQLGERTGKFYRVICWNCSATGPESTSPQTAWDDWDRRTTKSSTRKRVLANIRRRKRLQAGRK